MMWKIVAFTVLASVFAVGLGDVAGGSSDADVRDDGVQDTLKDAQSQASGQDGCDKMKQMIAAMKEAGSGHNGSFRLRVVEFSIRGRHHKEIYFKDEIVQTDLGNRTVFSFIADKMKGTPCFHVLYDCNFQTEDNSDKNVLIFLTWISNDAAMRNRIFCASSKVWLKRCMRGVRHQMEIYNPAEWTRQAIADNIQAKSRVRVAKIENVAI